MPEETKLPIRPSMPNTGRPSAGCDACRRMKVKCDEKRPRCAKCERVNRECHYRQNDRFVHMNPEPSRLVREKSHRQQRPGRREKRPRSRSPQQWPGTPQSSSHQPSPAPNHPGRPMPIDWEDAAVNFYLAEFVIYPKENNGQPGYFDFLPDLIKEEPEAVHLTEALKSVALSAMGNRSCMEQLGVQAQHSYGKALAQVRLALEDDALQKADSTLVTLILLGQYEIISGGQPSYSLWTSHSDGQAALLDLRGVEQLATERGRTLFRLAQSGVQRDAISGQPAPTCWRESVPETLFPNSLNRRLYDANNRVYETRCATAQLMNETSCDDLWYSRLHTIAVDQGRLLDQMEAITEFCRTDPSYGFWRPQNINRPPADEAEASTSEAAAATAPHTETPNTPLPRYAYVFATLVLASNLFYFWAIRAKLLEGLLNTVQVLQERYYKLPPALQPGILRTKLSQCIDDLCATLPFLFGELDNKGNLRPGGYGKCAAAYIALWPLHVLSGLVALEGPKRQWVLNRLTQISSVYGVRQALHLRDYRLRHGSTGTTSGAAAAVSIGATSSSVSAGKAAVGRGNVSGLESPGDAAGRGPMDSPRSLWFPTV